MRSLSVVLGLTCILLCQLTHAQYFKPTFSHTLGFSFYAANNEYASGGLLYSPRMNFAMLSDNASVSLGTHLGIGNSLDSDTDDSNNSIYNYSIDVPIVVEYNFGNGATNTTTYRFGGFIGGGYGFHNAQWKKVEGGYLYDKSLHIRGPVINGGLRFTITRTIPLGVRVGYMFNGSPGFTGVSGIGTAALFINIGEIF